MVDASAILRFLIETVINAELKSEYTVETSLQKWKIYIFDNLSVQNPTLSIEISFLVFFNGIFIYLGHTIRHFQPRRSQSFHKKFFKNLVSSSFVYFISVLFLDMI